jgi:hypothetical protein
MEERGVFICERNHWGPIDYDDDGGVPARIWSACVSSPTDTRAAAIPVVTYGICLGHGLIARLCRD